MDNLHSLRVILISLFVVLTSGSVYYFYTGYLKDKESSKLSVPLTPDNQKVKLVTPTAQREAIAGLSVVNAFDNSERTGSLFNGSVYTNPNISGITYRTSWKDLEPERGEYNFTKLDVVFSNAEKNGKWIKLIIVPGFGTPDWVLTEAQTAEFTVKYGQGKGQKLLLPLPWDKTYLKDWFAFLEVISKRYGNRTSFVMIAADGPTSVSSEMSLPNNPEDLLVWKAVGYTPEKYIEAWRQVFEKISQLFPNQHFSLALYPGLPIPSREERERVRQAVANIGINSYPSQFSLQTSGLNPLKDDDEGAGYQLVKQNQNKVLTGFMMSASFTEKQSKYGDPTTALEDAIERGMAAGARYLEVYEGDVLNPNLQSILANANNTLHR